jgi:hypothetical protein
MPGVAGNHQRFHACLQRWMDHRRETRVVIGRDVADLVFLLGFRVHAGISSADKPENGANPKDGPEEWKIQP